MRLSALISALVLLLIGRVLAVSGRPPAVNLTFLISADTRGRLEDCG